MRRFLNPIRVSAGLLLTAVFLCLCASAYANDPQNDGHAWGNKTLVKEANCLWPNTYVYTYADCGMRVQTTEGKPLPYHNLGPWEVATPATEDSEGVEVAVCADCHSPFSRTIPKLSSQTETEHTWGAPVMVKAATCIEQATYEYTCSTCGAKKQEWKGELGDHDWGPWVVHREPTADTEGLRERACSHGHRITEAIPALGQHKEHTWKKSRLMEPASCIAGDYYEYICTECGKADYRFEGSPDPNAHRWGNWYVERYPTAFMPGLEYRRCSVISDHVETREIPYQAQHEHQWGGKTLIQAATCQSKAKYQYTCEICNETMEQEEGSIDPMGHDYGPWAVVYPATATSDGMEEAECRLCHLSAQRTIPALSGENETEHTWGEPVKISDATCGNPALYEYTCLTCGGKKEEYVGGFAEHEWGEWIVDEEPTANTTGLKHRVCKQGHREDAVIDSLSFQHQQAGGHTWEKTKLIRAATCTHGEWWEYTCPGCGTTKNDYEGSPIPSAHDWTDWMVQDPATETEPGVEVRYCTENMEHLETRPIPALGSEAKPTETAAPQATAIPAPTPARTASPTPAAQTPTAEPRPTETAAPTQQPTKAPASTPQETAVPPHTHIWTDEGIKVSDATCKAPAKYRYTCTICGEEKLENEGGVNPDGHDPQWRIRRQPTMEEDGLRQQECVLCGAVLRVNRVSKLAPKIAIDEAHFPDPVFRQYILSQFDKDMDKTMTADDASSVWIIICRNLGIRDLTGIEFFPGLIYLDCGGNDLTELDLVMNAKLKTLIVSRNPLKTLNISGNPELCRAYQEGQKKEDAETSSIRFVLDKVELSVDAGTEIITEPAQSE